MVIAVTGEAIIGGGAVVGAALITGPLVYMFKKFDHRNTKQHADAEVARQMNHKELETIKLHVLGMRSDVTDVKGSLHEHITWHAHDNKAG